MRALPWTCLLAVLFPATGALAQPSPPAAPLRVAVAGSPPFVSESASGGDRLDGISVEVWTAMARQAGLQFEWVPRPSVPAALEALAAGEADVAVGPISITSERLERMEFTHRYFEAALGMASARVVSGPLDWLRPFASKPFLFGVAALLTVLVIVGTLLWWAERKANPDHFPPAPARGVANGVWMALVTMTTVGYGDRVPVTLAGRVLTGVWMLIAMVTASSLTAGIATALTLQQLQTSAVQSEDQLRGKRTAALAGTPAERFAVAAGARVLPTSSTDEALQAVLLGRADAVVEDRPILQYWLRQHPEVDLMLSERSYARQGYGFALPLRSPLTHRLNLALQELRESGRLDAIRTRWLGLEAG